MTLRVSTCSDVFCLIVVSFISMIHILSVNFVCGFVVVLRILYENVNSLKKSTFH